MQKSIFIFIAMLTTIAHPSISQPINNPWTFVYDGAITENVKGKVNIHPNVYKSILR